MPGQSNQIPSFLNTNNILQRIKWMRDGFDATVAKSFWAPMTNADLESVKRGMSPAITTKHVNTADFDQNRRIIFHGRTRLHQAGQTGIGRVEGKEESIDEFHDELTQIRVLKPMNLGNVFESSMIGNRAEDNAEHGRAQLQNWYMRQYDQIMFDTLCGALRSSAGNETPPSHVITITGTTFDLTQIVALDTILTTGGKQSGDYSTGSDIKRPPMQPATGMRGAPDSCYFLILHPYIYQKFSNSALAQASPFPSGAKRSSTNPAWSHDIPKIKSIGILEAPVFNGTSPSISGAMRFEDLNVENSGLRLYKRSNNRTYWEGQSGYDAATGPVMARNLLIGANAMRFARPAPIDYTILMDNYDELTKIALKTNLAWKKCNYTKVNGDLIESPYTGYDVGVIPVDMAV